MSDEGAQHPDVAGSGDVNDLGAEIAQDFREPAPVAQKQEIERHVAFEREASARALNFQGPHGTILHQSIRRRGVHVQERQSASARECIEMTVGVSDAIDFVKRISEERDARRGILHSDASCAFR